MFRAVRRGLSRLLLLTATVGAWTLLAVAFTWVLGAVGWYLIIRLWMKELPVPQAVSSTALAVVIAIAWAIFLWSAAFLWARYHYSRYFKRNKRKLVPLVAQADDLPWQESFLALPCPTVTSAGASSAPLFLRNSSATSLISTAMQLAEKGELARAASLLRLALASEPLPPLAKVATLLHLAHVVRQLGNSQLAGRFWLLGQLERRRLWRGRQDRT